MCTKQKKRKGNNKIREREFNKGYGELNAKDYEIHITDHFYKRTMERCGRVPDEEELKNKDITHISGEYYSFDDMIVVVAVKDSTLTLITNLGNVNEQPMIMNSLVCDGAYKFMKYRKKYGNLVI